jgi:hypothetical protein
MKKSQSKIIEFTRSNLKSFLPVLSDNKVFKHLDVRLSHKGKTNMWDYMGKITEYDNYQKIVDSIKTGHTTGINDEGDKYFISKYEKCHLVINWALGNGINSFPGFYAGLVLRNNKNIPENDELIVNADNVDQLLKIINKVKKETPKS